MPRSRSTSRPGGRILVLDDEPVVRAVVVRMLAGAGFEARCTGDGDECVAAFRTAMASGRPFDGVLLDLNVPRPHEGARTLARLRALDPTVRAIATSGDSRDPVIVDCRRHGFACALAKPFGGKELLAALAEAGVASDTAS